MYAGISAGIVGTAIGGREQAGVEVAIGSSSSDRVGEIGEVGVTAGIGLGWIVEAICGEMVLPGAGSSRAGTPEHAPSIIKAMSALKTARRCSFDGCLFDILFCMNELYQSIFIINVLFMAKEMGQGKIGSKDAGSPDKWIPAKKIGDDMASLMGADTDGTSSSRSAPFLDMRLVQLMDW